MPLRMKKISGQILLVAVILFYSVISIQADETEINKPIRTATHDLYELFEDEYLVKPGDSFFIGIIGAETVEMIRTVTLTGRVVLHPLSSAVEVGGLSYRQAKDVIRSRIEIFFLDVDINIELNNISPQRLHLIGAFNNPGEYVVDTLVTLYQAMEIGGGLSPAASKKIKVIRQGVTKIYDINDYLLYGKIDQNPILLNDDLIVADFAESFAKLYVVTDSVNYVEYYELKDEKPLYLLLKGISNKYRYSDYGNLSLIRNREMMRIEKNHLIRAGDTVYLEPERSYIFVRGNVNNPGKFSYIPGQKAQYYISNAGGITRVGSNKKIFIIDEDGYRIRYYGQPLYEGDTVIVPLSNLTLITDYLTPISAALSIVTTFFILTR